MLEVTLLALGFLGQVETPTMQFTNKSGGPISVWIYSFDKKTWEKGKKAMVVPDQATASVKLYEGTFQVVARNEDNVEDRNNRKLVARELDWMDFEGIFSGEPGRRPKAKFKITEHPKDDQAPPPGPAPAAPPPPPSPAR